MLVAFSILTLLNQTQLSQHQRVARTDVFPLEFGQICVAGYPSFPFHSAYLLCRADNEAKSGAWSVAPLAASACMGSQVNRIRASSNYLGGCWDRYRPTHFSKIWLARKDVRS